jgi:hypothetical protein
MPSLPWPPAPGGDCGASRWAQLDPLISTPVATAATWAIRLPCVSEADVPGS